jgi:hypothetical protein
LVSSERQRPVLESEDAINAVLAANGHNLRLLRRWLERLFADLLGRLASLPSIATVRTQAPAGA